MPAARADRARRTHFAALAEFPEARALLVAALRAHRALVRGLGSWRGVRGLWRLTRRSRATSDDPARRAGFQADARGPTASSSQHDGALRHPRLQDRFGAAPTSRCAPGLRRSSRSKPRFCARADSARSPTGGSVAELAYVALRGAEPPATSMRDRLRRTGTPDAQADQALAKLAQLVTRFEDARTSRIARSSIRCGRRATATTTTWRASRNGRRPAVRRTRVVIP